MTESAVADLDSLPLGWHRLRNRDARVQRWKQVWRDGIEWYAWGESDQLGCDYSSAELVENGWSIYA